MTNKPIWAAGLSCRFPESDNPHEFFQNLLNKTDMVTEDDRRWTEKFQDYPRRCGKIKRDLDQFDHRFFSIHGKLAEKLDPQIRLLFEVSYEALVDAGFSLDDIKGDKTGVYVGGCFCEAGQHWLRDLENVNGYEIVGGVLSLLAHRLSYFYDAGGPSILIDNACASSLTALHYAVKDLQSGACDVAIIGGASLILSFQGGYSFYKYKLLSPDGACKSFDQAANGYVRADGIGVLILTTRQNLVYRPYAKLLASGINNGGWNEYGITFPSGRRQRDLYRAVCKEANFDPKNMQYLEAHGTGTVAGDAEELSAIYEVYGKDNPELMIGSVKSNMGHPEGAAGLAGMIKTLLCFEHNTLVPNLHLKNPNEKLAPMKVATEVIPSWTATRAGVSSFGFGGANAHVLLEKCQSEEVLPVESPIPLTLLAHRTHKGLYQLKRALNGKPLFLANIENKHKLPFREVAELPDDTITEIASSPDEVYFVCSGNGSQWDGMGKKLYETVPSFKNTIDRCSKALDRDISLLLLNGCSDALESTLALVAVQLGLVHLLADYGIYGEKVGGFLGHSAGEIVCSYLDGVSTLEETMQIAHARGFVAFQMEEGLMASIGQSKDVVESWILESQCQDRVAIACINSSKNVTISGSQEAVLHLVEKAKDLNLFTRVLETHKKAYHSPLLTPHLATLHEKLLSVCRPQKRSSKWSTSVAGSMGDEFTAFYHVDAMQKPVDFIKALQKIPQGAIVVEIGPHPVLKALILESRPDLQYVSLMKKQTDDLLSVQEGLGKLWKLGGPLEAQKKPVTPLERLPLEVRKEFVSWDYAETFPIPKEADFRGSIIRGSKYVLDLTQERYQFLKSHKIYNRMLISATYSLCLLWEEFCKSKNMQISDSVNYVFTDFEILQTVFLEQTSKVELVIRSLGSVYELMLRDEVIARVSIHVQEQKTWNPSPAVWDETAKYIDMETFYRIYSRFGGHHEGVYRSVQKLLLNYEKNCNTTKVQFTKDLWAPFLDGILQGVVMPPRWMPLEMHLPIRIRSIEINPAIVVENLDALKQATVVVDFNLRTFSLAGIEISGLEVASSSQKGKDPFQIVQHGEGLIFYGENLVTSSSCNLEADFYTRYGAKQLQEAMIRHNLMDHPRYQKVLQAYGKKGSLATASDEEIALYRKEYNPCVRITDYCYGDRFLEFIENPIRVISQHPEYHQLYDSAQLFDRGNLIKALSIVRENVPEKPDFSIKIWEIGTGTGGMTKLLTPYLIDDQYMITDILNTAPFEKCNHLSVSYQKFDLDDRNNYESLKKYDPDLVVASNALHTCKNIAVALASLYASLKEGAFMMFCEVTSPHGGLHLFGMDSFAWSHEDSRDYGFWLSVDSWLVRIKEAGFELISYFTDSEELITMFFVRKPIAVKLECKEAPTIDRFETWSTEIKALTQPTLLVARHLDQAGVVGFVRCFNREIGSQRVYSVLTDEPLTDVQFSRIERLGLQSNRIEGQKLGFSCLVSMERQEPDLTKQGFYAKFTTPGNFSSAVWKNVWIPQESRCTVNYAALNFRDVMLASGKLSFQFLGIVQATDVGCEFSGLDSKGRRCMGFTWRGIANQVREEDSSLILTPEFLSDAEAATIPIIYVTVYHSLFERACIEPHHSILIHAGLGGVGQAAICVCLHLGCDIFVTCHPSKKEALLALYPQLKEDQIFNSRTTEFEKQILQKTGGRGVDIVLNSLSGDKLQASLRCVAQNGHFLEIGKYDLEKHTPLDMNLLSKCISIHGIDLHKMFLNRAQVQKLLVKVGEGILQGVVKPIQHEIFDFSQLDEAFRLLGTAKHKGKVLIDMRHFTPEAVKDKIVSSFYHDPEETGYYLITGGLGGIGLCLLHWLFNKGARRFVLTSRRNTLNEEQCRVLTILRNAGAEVIISTKNMSQKEDVAELFQLVPGKICGVFHLAMVLHDALFQNMTPQEWDETVQIKARGAMYLDEYTRSHDVKWFIMFSSIAGRIGQRGQSNYAFGNSVADEICSRRKKAGYHALSIQWGLIQDAGIVANGYQIASSGMISLQQSMPVTCLLDCLDSWMVSPPKDPVISCHTFIPKDAQATIESWTYESVLAHLSKILKIDFAKYGSSNDTLISLGVDSLQLVEIQIILGKVLRVVMPFAEIGKMTVKELRDAIAKQANAVPETIATPSDAIMPILHEMHPVTEGEKFEEVVYLFAGLGVDVLSLKWAKPSKFRIVNVLWQHAASNEELRKVVEKDIAEKGYKDVKILTHSVGYWVANEMIKKGEGLPISKMISISMISLSLVREGYLMRKDLGLTLETISEEQYVQHFKKLVFAPPNHLPGLELRKQVRLLNEISHTEFVLPQVHLCPQQDTLCQKLEENLEIAGTHDLGSLEAQDVYMHI